MLPVIDKRLEIMFSRNSHVKAIIKAIVFAAGAKYRYRENSLLAEPTVLRIC